MAAVTLVIRASEPPGPNRVDINCKHINQTIPKSTKRAPVSEIAISFHKSFDFGERG